MRPVLGVLGLWLLSGCGGEAPKATSPQPFATARYQDVVVDQASHGTFDPQTGVHTCADESRDSFVLAAGESRSFRITLAGPSEILLGGCVEGAPAGVAAEVALGVESPGVNWQEERVVLAGRVAGASGWHMRRIARRGAGAHARCQHGPVHGIGPPVRPSGGAGIARAACR